MKSSEDLVTRINRLSDVPLHWDVAALIHESHRRAGASTSKLEYVKGDDALRQFKALAKKVLGCNIGIMEATTKDLFAMRAYMLDKLELTLGAMDPVRDAWRGTADRGVEQRRDRELLDMEKAQRDGQRSVQGGRVL